MKKKDVKDVKWVLIVVCLILAFILLISFMKLKVKIDILHAGHDDQIKVKVMAFFGLLSYTYNVPFVKIDKDSPSVVVKSKQQAGSPKATDTEKQTTSEKKVKITPDEILQKLKQVKEFLNHVVHLHRIIKKFMSHITIHKLEWKSSIGTGEAAQTGMAAGIMWSLKGGIVGIVSKYMKLKAIPELAVIPDFQAARVTTKVKCIFSFRIGYAIVGALSVVKYWKSTKGGKQHVRTSNSRLNDNSYGKLEAND